MDVVNILTGNLDKPGGAMFTKAAAAASNTKGKPGEGRGIKVGRWTSRVGEMNEVFGELPVAALADEIETPGEGQVRALFTIAGNPAVSTPNSDRLAAALDSLELMVCIDIYVNETTRHADVILPAPSALQRVHYDLALYQFAANVANFSPATLPLDAKSHPEWQTLLRLTGIAAGQGSDPDIEALDAFVVSTTLARDIGDPYSPLHGRNQDELMAALEPRTGPERILDLMLRTGPYGDGFGADPSGLSLEVPRRDAARRRPRSAAAPHP